MNQEFNSSRSISSSSHSVSAASISAWAAPMRVVLDWKRLGSRR